MKVLLDTNIVLDFLLQHEPFFQDAEILFQAVASDRVRGYIAATTLTDFSTLPASKFAATRRRDKQFQISLLLSRSVLSIEPF